jgi:putative tryptophan/tyrosine transport system substrate-binding protein
MKINKKTIIFTAVLVIILVAAVFFLCYIHKPKVYHVGIIYAPDFFAPTVDGFKEKMTELGYTENVNIIYDLQKAPYSTGNQEIIRGFIKEKVDLIFCLPTEISIETKKVSEEAGIPVVFADAFIEGNDLIENIREPGGNITGVRYSTPGMSVKRLEILHEIQPDAKRIWVPRDLNYPTVPPTMDLLRPAAETMGIILVETNASGINDINAELQTRNASNDIGMDAILLIVQPIATMPDVVTAVAGFAKEHMRLLAGSWVSEETNSPTFAFSPDRYEIGVLAAPLADKILKGTPAGTIPVISPEGHLYINYKVIQELDLNVSEGLLARADEIIK